jgi:hypothetical protein
MRTLRAVGCGIALLAGCHFIGDVHDVSFVDEGACSDASQCPASECQLPVCSAGRCDVSNLGAHEPCAEGVCDGEGSCVACLDNGDCPSGPCQAHLCVAETCVDGMQDGMETDVDCGDGCAPCANGKSCVVPTDCASKVCIDFVCGACDAASCQDGYCSSATGECVPQKPLGASCEENHECAPPAHCDNGKCEIGD